MPFPVYAFAEFGGGQPAEEKLHREIVNGGAYTTNFLGVIVNYPALTCTVVFDAAPSGANQATVSAIVAAHNGIELVQPKQMFFLSTLFAAGGAGANDVVIYNANAPYDFRILNSYAYVSGVIALATLQVRSALGGLGNALSDAWVATLVGVKINVALPSAIPTVLAGGTLAIRRSNGNIAGEVVLQIERL